MSWVAGRYALRSARRNLRRSLLSMAGIAVGCALAVCMESLNRGRDELFARAGAYSGAGHLRAAPAAWPAERDARLRLTDTARALDAARALPGITAATARAHAEALLALGTHVVAVELTGVQPATEPATNRLVRTVTTGRYLAASDTGAIVIGASTATRLGAELDDQILATAVGRDGIDSAMFTVVGIVRTGSDDIDASVAHVPLDDLERLTSRRGASEVVVILDDWRRTDTLRTALAAGLATGDVAMTWAEVSPDFKGHMAQDQASARLVSAIILFIVILGVTSAQLASVLDRRREFAMLAAIGMSGRRMVGVVVTEALVIGTGGAALGLAAATPLVWRLAHRGLDLRPYMGTDFAFSGALFEPVMYGEFGWWIVTYTFGIAFAATLIASLYPARFAVRTDPAVALRTAP